MNVISHVIVSEARADAVSGCNPLDLLEGAESTQRKMCQVWVPKEVLA